VPYRSCAHLMMMIGLPSKAYQIWAPWTCTRRNDLPHCNMTRFCWIKPSSPYVLLLCLF
jgi:hypothetical protein